MTSVFIVKTREFFYFIAYFIIWFFMLPNIYTLSISVDIFSNTVNIILLKVIIIIFSTYSLYCAYRVHTKTAKKHHFLLSIILNILFFIFFSYVLMAIMVVIEFMNINNQGQFFIELFKQMENGVGELQVLSRYYFGGVKSRILEGGANDFLFFLFVLFIVFYSEQYSRYKQSKVIMKSKIHSSASNDVLGEKL